MEIIINKKEIVNIESLISTLDFLKTNETHVQIMWSNEIMILKSIMKEKTDLDLDSLDNETIREIKNKANYLLRKRSKEVKK